MSYPEISDEEREEILSEVAQLREWLEQHQVADQDFLRQAMIDGLRQFEFRLSRVRWFGYGYALNSLKDVIGAYFALERGYLDDGSMPIIGATLQKVGEGLKSIYQKAGFAKDAVERTDFIIRAYGAASIYMNAHSGGVTGLLTFSG
ncbi:MAG: hypothetical protein GC147_05815 [Porphyrobacter sp.]|nr:hypothetical protein [Porphyrobacter sp.]